MASVVGAQSSVTGNSTTSGGSQYQNDATQRYLNMLNEDLGHNYLWSLLGVIALVLIYSIIQRVAKHIRHLATMNNLGALRYFSQASPTFNMLKSKLLYAPMLYYRRAREIKFSRNVNFGPLPTRFQALFILLLVVTNVFTCTWNIPWSDPELQVLPILRNRTGTMAVVNLIPIMTMATVKNPLISLLDISYDTFNLMHRWLGRISILEAIVHALCWLIAEVDSEGWAAVGESVHHSFIYSGLIAVIGFTVIFLQSPKVVRNLAYEFFLHLHFVLVAIIIAFLWIHLEELPQRYLLLGAIIIWGVARTWRLATLMYRSVGRGGVAARIHLLQGDAIKISLQTPRPWTYRPGQSLYLTVPSIGLWTAHPFSVAWSGIEDLSSLSDSDRSHFNEKRPAISSRSIDVEAPGEPTISLIIKKQRGLTRQLWNHADKAVEIRPLTAYIEGPYGNERKLSSYGTVMLFTSGVGITHQLGYVRELVAGFAEGTVATKRLTLVWVIPSTECLDWIRPWMHEILAMERRREVLKILVYITRAGLSQSIRSPSEMVRMYRGRPNIEELMRIEAGEKIGCLAVSTCAGGELADEVRRVSRLMLNNGTNLDLIEEGFGW
ncbi:uncharacterized protein Z518_04408 [Rhinocladiella mackenziei CBS 650.93]|uniref:ferric-chelate reductase (NADPH) n=1 Tax=Rhinocladiella mackenziei CBS 650.93 TaxID=1442369 RepID=A0A0D2FW90_9EURO|nr:uncharacterized protein Z518_04408 [Rhinocladiella mackenziei CBS 650.93]KIX06432.1 hypothetical protein Z518_04408 [Rhinocladiella mackenziei CBS 650.93]